MQQAQKMDYTVDEFIPNKVDKAFEKKWILSRVMTEKNQKQAMFVTKFKDSWND